MLKHPTVGCLDGMDDVGVVTKIGISGNAKHVGVHCAKNNGETYYPIEGTTYTYYTYY
eukprot:SAG31_NODE_2139_length_6349_cov_2.773636_8_plen_58_part_00